MKRRTRILKSPMRRKMLTIRKRKKMRIVMDMITWMTP
jgi:hypothetical protein